MTSTPILQLRKWAQKINQLTITWGLDRVDIITSGLVCCDWGPRLLGLREKNARGIKITKGHDDIWPVSAKRL